MPVTTHRSSTTDLTRGFVVAVLAVLQLVIAGLGGSGVAGESVGDVARSYPTPVLPASWTFAIWGPIYLAFLGYAAYQLLPAQRGRPVHRATGWWLAASAVLNAGWILAFSARDVLLAELLILALLAVLARVFGRLSRERASGTLERAAAAVPRRALHGLGVARGRRRDGRDGRAVGPARRRRAGDDRGRPDPAGGGGDRRERDHVRHGGGRLRAAVVWALVGIALDQPPAAVGVAAAVASVVVLFATARRISTSGDPRRAAWG